MHFSFVCFFDCCFICLGTRSIFIDIDDSGMPPTSSGLEKNLIMGVVYLACVEAMNECGWGPPTPHVRFTTRSIDAPPSPWTLPDVMAGDTFVLVEWKEILNVDQYRLQYR